MTARIRHILLLFALVSAFYSLKAPAQALKATASMDTSTLLIGQQVILKLKLDVPAGQKLLWPVFTDSLAPGIEIVSKSPVDTLITANRAELTQRLQLTSFDTGLHRVPAIPFYGSPTADSATILALTNELMLEVRTVPVDTTKAFKDIKGVMTLPLTFWEVFRWVLLGLGILLLAGLGWFFYLKWKRKKPVFILPQRPPVPPYVTALEELEKLRNDKLWQQGLVKEYHTRLTDILRSYLEQQFRFPAPEMTTDEILESLRPLQARAEAVTLITGLLRLADLVKFAKEQPLPVQHDQSLKDAATFVRMTGNTATGAVNDHAAAPAANQHETP